MREGSGGDSRLPPQEAACFTVPDPRPMPNKQTGIDVQSWVQVGASEREATFQQLLEGLGRMGLHTTTVVRWSGVVSYWRVRCDTASLSSRSEGTSDVVAAAQVNYRPYQGDATFLAGPTERTLKLWGKASGWKSL